jgi:hypothetical protein
VVDIEKLIYLIFTLMVIVIAFTLSSSFKGIANFIALIFIILSAVMVLAFGLGDTFVFPVLMSTLGVTFTVAKDNSMTKKEDAIIKNVGGLTYATGFITANLFQYTFKEEVTQQEDEMKLIQGPSNWERAISALKFPWKYNIVSVGLDVQKVRDDLEGKRSFQQFQLARLMQSSNPGQNAIEEIQRNINIIQAKMDRISQGEKPIATLMYVETTAVGVTEKAAMDQLETQIRAIQIGFSSQDVQLMRVVGRELYTLFRYGFSVPTTFGEIADMFDQQG